MIIACAAKCPYCDTEQDINHDDGYGYDEDRLHKQECVACDREFRFSTGISFSYEVFCDGDHQWESWAPRHPQMEGCSRCDAARRIEVKE